MVPAALFVPTPFELIELPRVVISSSPEPAFKRRLMPLPFVRLIAAGVVITIPPVPELVIESDAPLPTAPALAMMLPILLGPVDPPTLKAEVLFKERLIVPPFAALLVVMLTISSSLPD